MKRLQSSIVIDATPEAVFAILADLSAYESWNPFMVHADGLLVEGAPLHLRIRPAGRKETSFAPTILEVEPDRRIRWLGSLLVRGLFDGEHRLEVEPIGDHRSRFTQAEEFRGILVPFTSRLLRGTQEGFERMNAALKLRAEERETL